MSQEVYSPSKAAEEAAKMKNIVGEKGLPDDYEVARGIVQDELLDNYFSFDQSLFYSNISGTPAEEEDNRAAGIKKYKTVLQRDEIKKVLAGQAPINIIPEDIITALRSSIGNEILPSGIMLKNTAMYSLDSLWEVAQVKKPDGDRKHYFESRTRNHLFRLLLPETYYKGDSDREKHLSGKQNIVCPVFAKDFIKFVTEMPNPSWEDADRFNRTIGAEGDAVSIFWTLAPYINDELKQVDFSSAASMQEIFNWIRAGYKKKEKTSNGYDSPSWDANCLDFIDQGIFHKYCLDFRLGLDERMPSHLLARLYAKSAVAQMLKNR